MIQISWKIKNYYWNIYYSDFCLNNKIFYDTKKRDQKIYFHDKKLYNKTLSSDILIY